MLVSIDIKDKTIGPKVLYKDLSLVIQPNEKLAIIGRNGVGKTTLFNILASYDDDFRGKIDRRRGLKTVATKQEFRVPDAETAFSYILHNLPEYAELKQILDQPETMAGNMKQIGQYSEAVERFTHYGYFDVEPRIYETLEAYQIPRQMADQSFNKLSGGQKRFVELVRVELSGAELALIDEPTNHMDYVAKAAFIKWLKSANHTVVVITHDRDVLAEVDRIIEIKDSHAYSFPGNYQAYLQQNSRLTVGQMDQWEVTQRTIARLKQQIAAARAKKPTWGGTADKKNPFVVIEERLTKQLKALQAEVQRPTLWMDQESVQEMHNRVVERYDKYKARNIRIKGQAGAGGRELIKVTDLSLGYGQPLFSGVSFSLGSGDILQLRGRNGAGKTSLIRAILADWVGQKPEAKTYGGKIELDDRRLKIGVYEQEISPKYLETPLQDAIIQVYRENDVTVNEQKAKQIMADYLFDPVADANLPLSHLSGGQKARFQIIAMLCGDPSLLILDEPTNHLDLPSIEELEKALASYEGAILYVSHDSYFARNLGGSVIELESISPS